jgi:Fanconi anemia group M protein
MGDTQDYFEHPYIEDESIEKRDYQTRLANAAVSDSTLIALPTGTGKTVVAAMAVANRLSATSNVDNRRVLFLAPTKPLVEQHVEDFRDWFTFPDHEIKMFTGDTRPAKRSELWDEPSTIVVATPQVIENDLIASRISLDSVVHLIFDECHKATGEYAYNYIADIYWDHADHPLVTGLSASPGSDEDAILNVCDNLGLTDIEVLTDEDDELSKHTSSTEFSEIKVNLGDGVFDEVKEELDEPYTEVLKELKEIGVIDSRDKTRISLKVLNKSARARASELIDEGDGDGYRAQSLISEATNFHEARQAVMTKGLSELRRKFRKWADESENGKSKAAQRFMGRPEIKQVQRLIAESDDTHPKMKELRPEIVRTLIDGGQALVFVDSLQMAEEIADFLSNDKIRARKFVGQQGNESVDGMSQKEQSRVLDEFRDGVYDVLVATEVAEEGLDIPSVDLVAIYEPSGQAIRKVQQSGRTGREAAGKVVVFMTKYSADEGRYYKSIRQEKKMKEGLKELKEMEVDISEKLGESQSGLEAFVEPDVEEDSVPTPNEVDETEDETKDSESHEFESNDESGVVVYVDDREMKSSVVKKLSKMSDISVRVEQLDVGDYIVSDRCAIERKSAIDFKSTITSGERDLFKQLGDMKSAYSRSVLMLEGPLDDFFKQGIHPNAVRGTISAAVLGMGSHNIHSRDEDETAEYVATLARREQEERDRDVSAHGSKSTKTQTQQQEYIVSSIMDIGPVTSKNLLSKFGNVRSVMSASKDELMEVENVGETTAGQIVSVITEEYEQET